MTWQIVRVTDRYIEIDRGKRHVYFSRTHITAFATLTKIKNYRFSVHGSLLRYRTECGTITKMQNLRFFTKGAEI